MKCSTHNRIVQTVPGVMHTIKDAVEHVVNIIVGKEDNAKVNGAEEAIGHFQTERICPKKARPCRSKQVLLPPYRMMSEEITIL